MALITLSELKAVLGIGDIYADAIVQAVADSAENIILSYLIFDDVAIKSVSLTSNVATLTTAAHGYKVGDVVTVAGVGKPFDGTHTITTVATTTTFAYKVAFRDQDIGQSASLAVGNFFVILIFILLFLKLSKWKELDQR